MPQRARPRETRIRVTLQPLPLAPRPYAGEALSSWVRRIAARYDVAGDNLLTHVLQWRRSTVGAACDSTIRLIPSWRPRWQRQPGSPLR